MSLLKRICHKNQIIQSPYDGYVSEQTLNVWLSLPQEIREDEALISFRRQYDRLNGSRSNANTTNDRNEVSLDKRKEFDGFCTKVNVKGPVDASSKSVIDTKQSAIYEALFNRNYIKIIGLTLIWLILTIVLANKIEKTIPIKQIAIPNSNIKFVNISEYSTESKIMIQIDGPLALNNSANGFLDIELDYGAKSIKLWKLSLEKSFKSDNIKSRTLKKVVEISGESNNTLRLKFHSNLNYVLPLKFGYDLTPLDERLGIICGAAILIILYVLIIFEFVHRTFGAIIASLCGISTLALLNSRPTMAEIVTWMDMESLMLLFSMMVLVAVLAETGIFDVIAVHIFKFTKGQTWPLIYCLCIASALFSSLLDNVTIILLMTPLTIRLCEVVNLNPKPILMAVVLYTNIGGTMTPIGGPPNIMITSNSFVSKQGLSFLVFSMHMSIGAILIMIQTACQFRWIFKDMSTLKSCESKEIAQIHREIGAWKKAIKHLGHFPKGTETVRKILKSKTKSMKQKLRQYQLTGTMSTDSFAKILQELEKGYKIKSQSLLIKSGLVFAFVIGLFLVQSMPAWRTMSLGWCALLGVILLLIISGKDDFETILHQIDWATLIFFTSMFVTMECLSQLGLVIWIGSLTESIILCVRDDALRLALAIIIVLWVSALTSSFVDAIPVTAMMLKVVIMLAQNPALNLPLQPLIWALAYGPSIGGNGTLYGASANTVCASVASHQGYKIHFFEYMRVCYPIMLGNILIITAYLMAVHVLWQWH